MLRPAGPRISSMMLETRSAGRYWTSSRSVASKLPSSAPDAESRPTNSSIRLSTESASTVPMVDMTIESWRSSSSSSSFQTLSPCFSPSASISTAARSGPVSLRPGPPADLAAGERRDEIGDLVGLVGCFCGCCGHGSCPERGVLEPLADDRHGLVRIAFGELADLLHRLRVHLALHLRHVDHLGGLAGRQGDRRRRQGGATAPATPACPAAPAAAGCGFSGVRMRRTSGRTTNSTTTRPSSAHHGELDRPHDVVLGQLQERHEAARLLDRRGGRLGEAQVDDLDLVAALLVEADRGAHQRGDAVELLLGARLVGGLALFVLGVAAVDQHGGRDALDAPALGDLRLGRAGDLVVDDLLRLLALVALAAAGPAGLADLAGSAARPATRCRRVTWPSWLPLAARLLARLARAQHAALGIELVERLGDAVEVEFGGELHAGAARPDHRGDDRFDLVLQPPLVAGLALFARAADRGR